MSKLRFSIKNIENLNRNPNVLRVSNKSITYSDDFKRHFIEEYLSGKIPHIIFHEAGFDIEIIGMKRIEQSSARWLKIYNNDGIIGLRDMHSENSGRPRFTELSSEEIITRQDAKIKLLEEQVSLLKKSDRIERRPVNARLKLKMSEIFQLIHDTVAKYELSNMISPFCGLPNVSRSGYYNYTATANARKERKDAEYEPDFSEFT